MWGLPGSVIEPMSPALAGRVFTTEPPKLSSFIIYTLPHSSHYIFGKQFQQFSVNGDLEMNIVSFYIIFSYISHLTKHHENASKPPANTIFKS